MNYKATLKLGKCQLIQKFGIQEISVLIKTPSHGDQLYSLKDVFTDEGYEVFLDELDKRIIDERSKHRKRLEEDS